jgi:hypothetical protein
MTCPVGHHSSAIDGGHRAGAGSKCEATERMNNT